MFSLVSADNNPSVFVVSLSELNKSGAVSPSTPKFSSPLETWPSSVKLLSSISSVILIASSEKDFSDMMGMIDLNLEYKMLLLVHFLSKIFTFKFIFVFGLITFLRFFLVKFINQIYFKEIKLFILVRLYLVGLTGTRIELFF